jgi:hypothetical protein
MALTNKYFFRSTDDYYNYGKVVDDLGDSFYLVKFHGGTRPHNVVFHLAQMTEKDEMNSFNFFDTEEELNEYVEWIETPSEKKNVVSLVKES